MKQLVLAYFLFAVINSLSAHNGCDTLCDEPDHAAYYTGKIGKLKKELRAACAMKLSFSKSETRNELLIPLLIDEEGNVLSHGIPKNSNYEIALKLLPILEKLKWQAATKNEQAVCAWLNVLLYTSK